MIRLEDQCVCCPSSMGCMGDSCPNRNVPMFYCDECRCETDILRVYDNKQLCQDCFEFAINEEYETIDNENYENYIGE